MMGSVHVFKKQVMLGLYLVSVTLHKWFAIEKEQQK